MTESDLDKLEAMLTEMTPAPWHPESHRNDTGPPSDIWCVSGRVAECHRGLDAAGIAALVNAAPDLIRLARLGETYMVYTGRIALAHAESTAAKRELDAAHVKVLEA